MPDAERAAQAAELIDVLTVERVDGEGDAFRAAAPDWYGDRLFGGVVVAQAVSAAVQTLDPEAVAAGFRPHSLHGYFLGPVRPGAPVELSVRRVRDGRTFVTRDVVVRQGGRTAFAMTCSACTDEPGDEYERPMPAGVPWASELPDEPEDWGGPGPFEVREAGPTPARPDGFRESTRRAWFRFAGTVPDDPMVHVVLAAFLSDMTGTSFRPLSLDAWGRHTDASLDHAVWFHRPFRVDDWLLYDLQALVNGGGRSLVRGCLYEPGGTLCLSLAQELLIRELDEPLPDVPHI